MRVLSAVCIRFFLFGHPAGSFPAQVYVADPAYFQGIAVYVVVKGFLADTEFRVCFHNPVRGNPLFQERGNYICNLLRPGCIQVYAGSCINKCFAVFVIGGYRIIPVFVKMAPGPLAAAVAGSGGTVPPGTFEFHILPAVGCTFPAVLTLPVVVAFQREGTLVHAFAMLFNLLADGGLVFPESGSDGSFCGAVFNSGFDDFSFLKRQSRLFIVAVRMDCTSFFKNGAIIAQTTGEYTGMVCAPRLFFGDIRGRDAGREPEIREVRPYFEGLGRNGKGRKTVGAVFFMDSLPDKLPGKMGKGTEKRTVEGKCEVCSGINETNNLYFDRKGKPVTIEEKDTGIQAVSPDRGTLMALVVTGLKLQNLVKII